MSPKAKRLVYVASRFYDKERARALAKILEDEGFAVTSRWFDYESALGTMTDEHRRHVAQLDAYDVRQSQALVFWNPSDRVQSGGGCHVEVGMALALGIPVFVLGERENVFHWAPGVTFVSASHLRDPVAGAPAVMELLDELEEQVEEFNA